MQLKVLQIRSETKDSHSIIFEKPGDFSFYPGQYLDIALKLSSPPPLSFPPRRWRGKLRRESIQSRIMSISSSPSEDFLMITYKEGMSPYKRQLRELQSGDTVESTHPAGTVVIDDSAPIVMLAGGIGIAPHRSMIKWAVDRKLNLPITLIYSNSDDDFIFKKELYSWQKQYPKLIIHYVVTNHGSHLDEAKLKLFLNSQKSKDFSSKFLILNSTFYLAGPPAMVDDFENILLNLRVDSVNIRTDRFDGY